MKAEEDGKRNRAMLHDSLSSALLELQATTGAATPPTAAAASGETGVSLGTCTRGDAVRLYRLKHRAVPSAVARQGGGEGRGR